MIPLDVEILKVEAAMFGLSVGHLIILAVVILIFGARRLPELGSSLGKGLRNFKRAMEGDGLAQKAEQLQQNETQNKHQS